MDFLSAAYNVILDAFFPSTLNSLEGGFLSLDKFLTHTTIRETTIIKTTKREYLISNHIQPALLSITSLFPYHDTIVHEAIWELKYRGNKKIAGLFARIIYDILVEHLSDAYLFETPATPLIIPIPSSRERRQERGFNQIELIARELARLDHNNFFTVQDDVLVKSHTTLPQASLGRHARLTNVIGSFSLADHIQIEKNKYGNGEKNLIIKNKDIILLDDVATTGSTLEEAARVLQRNGAHSVCAFTIAH